MDASSWARVEVIFDRAQELDGPARVAFLESACAGDPDLRTEVEGLLRAAELSDDFLEVPVGQAFGEQLGPILGKLAGHPSRKGKRIGAFRIVEPIGHGGMGRIFRAERADGAFSQQVALKILRWEIADDEAVTRFQSERQLLASLQHPGIARLLDGGVTEDGLPYLVMELVEGIPIDDYCRERRLSLEDRLRLFQRVCGAVQFAHGNLVVHRDLKPSNILVADDGSVKLLDFGIAKLLEGPGSVGETQWRPLTPGYAAPEQITGEPLSTATDVYALGVILHQLLTGSRPHESDPATITQLTRRIVEEDPTTPSHRVREGTAGIPADRWAKSLRGDLDSIVLKALRRRPSQRYSSAEALSEDIDRHLTRRPVRARRRGRAYVVGRFVSRHRLPVFASIGIVVAIALGVASTQIQARRAIAEAERAQNVSEMILSLFEFADPYEGAPGGEYRAEDLLDRGLELADTRLANDPETLAPMLVWIGAGYDAVGARMKARTTVERAEALSRQHAPGLPLARSLTMLGVFANDEYRFETAAVLLTEAWQIRVALGDTASADAGRVRAHLGRTFARADAEAALVHVDAAKELIGKEADPNSSAMLNLEGTRAEIYRNLGELAVAESIYVEVVDRWRALDPSGPSEISSPLNNLAIVRRQQGDLKGAEIAYREALEVLNRFSGAAHPTTLRVRSNLAGTLGRAGDLAGAEALLLENIEAVRTEFPERVDDIANRLAALGGAYLVWGRPADAATVFRESVEHHRAAGPAAVASEAMTRLKLSVALSLADQPVNANIEWGRGVGYFTQPDAGPLNSSGISQLRWLLDQCEQHERPNEADRIRSLIEQLEPSGEEGSEAE